MSYNIFPSDGDTVTEAEWTTILDRANARDYVERGLTVSLNGDGTFDVGAGLAFIRDTSTNQTYPVEDESGTTGVQLADTSTTNYVYLTFDPSASDVEGSVEYHVDTDQTPPAGQPSLLIAEADESTSTVTPRNPEPSVTAESTNTTGLKVNDEYLWASDFDGSDADTRLDNALNAASDGDVILLENDTYSSTRTINSFAGTLLGSFSVSANNGAVVSGDWTLDSRVHIYRIAVESNADLNPNVSNIHLSDIDNQETITVGGDRAVIQGVLGGSITFQSGTSGGIVDSSTDTTVTDNGSNTVGDLG